MPTITEQIAALPGWQRARIDWLRVAWGPSARSEHRTDGWSVVVTWQGMSEVAEPGAALTTPAPDGVAHAAWVKPDPLVLSRPDGTAMEGELHELVHSGLIGDATCDRIEEPGAERVRWRVQAWVGRDMRVLLVDGRASWGALLGAHADVTAARYSLALAEGRLTAAMGDALTDGLSATVAARALGLSRGRIYQIRDGGR